MTKKPINLTTKKNKTKRAKTGASKVSRSKVKKRPRKNKSKQQKGWLGRAWRGFREELTRVNGIFFKRVGCATILLIGLGVIGLVLLYQWSMHMSEQREAWLIEQERYEARLSFIKELAPTAQEIQRETGIYASVSLAQASLESNFGTSELASQYHNLYGVKTSADDPEAVALPTLEYLDGEWVEITDRFKVYQSWQHSMRSHAQLITGGTSWDSDYYKAVLDGATYQEQARGLQKSGYATDPTYADKLINLIAEWQLDQYDHLPELSTEAPS